MWIAHRALAITRDDEITVRIDAWTTSHKRCPQDAHTIKMGIDGAPEHSWFAVFDGHGGTFTSKYAAAKVLEKICSTPEWAADRFSPVTLGNAMVRGFLDLDEDLKKVGLIAPPLATHGGSASRLGCFGVPLDPALIKGNRPSYLLQTPDIMRGDDHSGSTAISAIVTPSHIVCGNVGDSRCILLKGNEVRHVHAFTAFTSTADLPTNVVVLTPTRDISGR